MPFLLSAENIVIDLKNQGGFSSLPNFAVSKGDLLELRGPNGSGKSTFLLSILKPNNQVKAKVVLKSSSIQLLPQLMNREFFAPMSLLDVVKLSKSKISASDIFDVGFFSNREQLSRLWNSASGGERQKIFLTSIFLANADLVLLNEPFNHLDNEAKKILSAQIDRMRKAGVAFVVVTHGNEPFFQDSKPLQLIVKG